MADTTLRPSFLLRLFGAAALDSAIYEEVEADRAATGQAMLVVVMSSLAAGVGVSGLNGISPRNAFGISAIALVAWAAWALLTFEVGTRVLPGTRTHSDVGELLRTIGFAAAPGLLLALGVLPGVTVPIFVMASVWMLAAMIVAVRQALDYDNTAHAVAVCVFGWGLAVSLVVIAGSFLATPVE